MAVTGFEEQSRTSEDPFLLSWVEGRCPGCRFASSLGFVQFAGVREAWGIGDGMPPPGGEGTGEHIVVHSSDGGRTWAELPFTHMHAVSPTVTFLDSLHGWIGWGDPLGDFRLIHTRDGGRTWQDVPGTFERAPVFLDETHWCWADAGKFVETEDAGATWRETEIPRLGDVNRMFFLTGGIGWIASVDGDSFKVFRTRDGGRSWKESMAAVPGHLTNVADMFFLTEERGWLITWQSLSDGSELFATADGGQTWVQEPDRSLQGNGRLASVVRFLSASAGLVFEREELVGARLPEAANGRS